MIIDAAATPRPYTRHRQNGHALTRRRDRCREYRRDILEARFRIELSQTMLPLSSRNSLLDRRPHGLQRRMAMRITAGHLLACR